MNSPSWHQILDPDSVTNRANIDSLLGNILLSHLTFKQFSIPSAVWWLPIFFPKLLVPWFKTHCYIFPLWVKWLVRVGMVSLFPYSEILWVTGLLWTGFRLWIPHNPVSICVRTAFCFWMMWSGGKITRNDYYHEEKYFCCHFKWSLVAADWDRQAKQRWHNGAGMMSNLMCHFD